MFGFTDFSEYRRNEQDLDRRNEQARVAREQRDTARRQAAERRATERAARTKQADAIRPRAA
ncbi:hypothetical protein [Promicromonospora panici]|uniref:hypothetical protein n=1 Tax=Promicromonospora panici TaxID=2219658 RepID=UPI00101B8A59|nr:hypothetical protein [Promicromonospora panici]